MRGEDRGKPWREPRGVALLAERFALAPFDRAVLSIATEVELTRREVPEPDRHGRATIASLLVMLADEIGRDVDLVVAHLGPGSALVRYGLVVVEGDGPFRTRSLRVPDDVWQRLLDPSAPPSLPIERATPDALSQLVLSDEIRTSITAAVDACAALGPERALVVLSGPAGSGRGAVARAVFADRPVLVVTAEMTDPVRIAREAIWAAAAVIVEGAPPALLESAPIALAAILAPGAVPAVRHRAVIEIRLSPLGAADRAAIWEHHTGTRPVGLHARFGFGPARIVEAVAASRQLAGASHALDESALHRAALALSRQHLPRLASRLDDGITLADLVLPPETRRELDLIAAWAIHGHVITPHRLVDSTTLACLFHGVPGTGKTMAARALAAAIGLDVLRVDLSQVVDKYIGETEKQLERLFDEVVATNAILFFDEADALFGKRTKIRDAHDRYANVQTGYLLQRIESHRGLVVLATNLHTNIDPAFLRRLHVMVEFPRPGVPERVALWERHLPVERADDVDPAFLARNFTLTGGAIRGAVLTARLYAAQAQRPLGMTHLLRGVFRELHRDGRIIDLADFEPWHGEIMAWANEGG